MLICLGADLPSCLQLTHQNMTVRRGCLLPAGLLASVCAGDQSTFGILMQTEQLENIIHLTGHIRMQLLSHALQFLLVKQLTSVQKSFLCCKHSFKAPGFYKGLFSDCCLSRLPLKQPLFESVCLSVFILYSSFNPETLAQP